MLEDFEALFFEAFLQRGLRLPFIFKLKLTEDRLAKGRLAASKGLPSQRLQLLKLEGRLKQKKVKDDGVLIIL